MVKSGLHTTEFIATVLLNVGTLVASLQGSLSPKWAGIAGMVSVAAYALSRGLTKTNAATPAPPTTGTTPPSA